MPAKNYFSSPEQSLTKLAPDKGVIISIYFDFVFLVPDDYLQFDKCFWIQNVWKHFRPNFVYTFYQLVYQSNSVRFENSWL